MVLTALNANNYTQTAITVQEDAELQQEIDLTERAIRNAATRQKFDLVYDARIVGNPFDNPQIDGNLTPVQISYRDAFISAGYFVTIDGVSGMWKFSWSDIDIETLVSIYSIRTTVSPGAVSTQTISAINEYFAAIIPAVTAKTSLVNVGSGGDIDEALFGATPSTFYEYIAIVRQQDTDADYSSGIKTALVTTTLGYLNTPSNVSVFKIS